MSKVMIAIVPEAIWPLDSHKGVKAERANMQI